MNKQKETRGGGARANKLQTFSDIRSTARTGRQAVNQSRALVTQREGEGGPANPINIPNLKPVGDRI